MQAFGTFVKSGEHVFRTEAYIQFGLGKNILGVVIMLNPGMAKLKASMLEDNKVLHDEITIDRTMNSLIKLIEKCYPDEKGRQGRLKIYNLFSLQNPKIKDAISSFEKLWQQQHPLITALPKPRGILINELKSSPWVLIGWGCGRSPESLTLVKEQWLQVIAESKTPVLGKKGKKYLDYHHPRPQLLTQQIEYQKELNMQFEKLMQEK